MSKRGKRTDYSEHSAAYKLFRYFYCCQVPDNEMYTVNDTDYFGIAASGSEEWDRRLATTMNFRHLTIAQCAELYADGVPLVVSDPTDTVTMYNIIVEHLKDWKIALESEIRVFEEIPIEGLAEFNALAGGLARVGRGYGLIKRPKKDTSGRSFSRRRDRKVDLTQVRHTDGLFNQIVYLAKKYHNVHFDAVGSDLYLEDQPHEGGSMYGNRPL